MCYMIKSASCHCFRLVIFFLIVFSQPVFPVYAGSSAAMLIDKANQKVEANQLDSAIFYYLGATGQYGLDQAYDSQAGVYNTLGNLFLGIADYEQALVHFVRAAEIYEQKTDNLTAFSRPLANIAVIHNIQGNHDQALYDARKSRDMATQAADTLVMSFTQRLPDRMR